MIPSRKTMCRAMLAAAAATLAAFAAGCAHTTLPAASAIHPQTGNGIRRYDDEWFAAARVGRTDILQALLDAHYPIDATTREGYTAVILTAYDDQPAALDFLLRAGADPCVGDRHGNTALMGALFKGETAIARRVMDTRCPIDQSNNAGETALAFAALFGRLDLLPQLIARGANPNHVDAGGRTVLRMAIEQGNRDSAVALERAGAIPDPDQAIRQHP
jgi:ankyrin repeat protein